VLSLFLAGPTGQARMQRVGDTTGARAARRRRDWRAGRWGHAGRTRAATATLGYTGTRCEGDVRGAQGDREHDSGESCFFFLRAHISVCRPHTPVPAGDARRRVSETRRTHGRAARPRRAHAQAHAAMRRVAAHGARTRIRALVPVHAPPHPPTPPPTRPCPVHPPTPSSTRLRQRSATAPRHAHTRPSTRPPSAHVPAPTQRNGDTTA